MDRLAVGDVMRDRIFIVLMIMACIVGFYRLELLQPNSVSDVAADGSSATDSALPDFDAFNDVKAKKAAFFDFMLPLILEENARVAEQRLQLVALSSHLDALTGKQQQWLVELAQEYRIVASHNKAKVLSEKWLIEELLLRVDQVPPSLALAQAANESAWGTSRFAEKGNNLYGQWCFKKGCGLVPNRRVDGARHEVAKFESPRHSVQRYIYNLNTNFAYTEFRKWRAEQRSKQEPLSGELAAMTLTRYSVRGAEYVDELQAMIRVNDLQQYDTI